MEYIIIIAIACCVWWAWAHDKKEKEEANRKRREELAEEEANRKRQADVEEFLRQEGEEQKEEVLWWNNVATLNKWVVAWVATVVAMVEELGKSQDKDTSYRANLLMERLNQEKLLGSSLAGFHVEDGIAGVKHLPDKIEFTLVPSDAFEKIRAEASALWKTEHRSDSSADTNVTRVPDMIRVARAADIVYGSVIVFELLIRAQAWGHKISGGRPQIFYSSVIDFELLIPYLIERAKCPVFKPGLPPLRERLTPFRHLRDKASAVRQLIRTAVAKAQTEEAATEVLKILDGDVEKTASAIPKSAALLMREQLQAAVEWAKEQEKVDERMAEESFRQDVLEELRRRRE